MNTLRIILAAAGAGFAAVNYIVYLAVSRRNSLPIAPVVLACIFIPVMIYIISGKKLDAAMPGLMNALKWTYAAVGMFYAVSFIIFISVINSGIEKTEEADVFIVFGCKTRGYTPSLMLGYRLDHAYELLEKNPGAYAVLSGGQGDDESVSEAESMRAYLVSRGIDENRLILEDRSTSTKENIEYSMEKLRSSGIKYEKIAAVSNDYHIKRILKQAKEAGYALEAAPAETPASVYLWSNLVREYMVWIKLFIITL